MSTNAIEAKEFSRRQMFFIRYFTAILVDLTVLNLLDEYWDKVVINSFSVSLLAALVLQIMLVLTFRLEHGVGSHFKKKGRKGMRIFSAWALLFGSKFVILWVLEMLFGDQIQFHGAYHGVITFIVVIVAMLAMEALVRWFVHKVLGDKPNNPLDD